MQTSFETIVDRSAELILAKYRREIDALKSTNISAALNGCNGRAKRMLHEMQDFGINGVILKLTLPHSPFRLAHESGGYFNMHYVVLDERMQVYDPNYTGGVPLSLHEYVPAAYHFPSGTLIWKDDLVIARYEEKLLMDLHNHQIFH